MFLSVVCYSVFWDLYCAAPERRDTCDHSSEAKAFHDYVSSFTLFTLGNMGKNNPAIDACPSCDVFLYDLIPTDDCGNLLCVGVM